MDRLRNIPYILNGELYQIQCQSGENVTVKCCNCPDRVYRGSVRSTGNFHMHIKRRHPDLLPRLLEMKVKALLERRDRYLQNRANKEGGLKRLSVKQEPQASAIQMTIIPRSALKFAQESSEPPPLALMDTHKLKIKSAFQRRHTLEQQQQQQQQIQAAKEQFDEEATATLTPAQISDAFAAEAIASNNNNNNEPLDYTMREINVENAKNTSDSERTPIERELKNHSVEDKSVGCDYEEPRRLPFVDDRMYNGMTTTCHHFTDGSGVACFPTMKTKTTTTTTATATATATIVKSEEIIEQAMDLSSSRRTVTSSDVASVEMPNVELMLHAGSELAMEMCPVRYQWNELLVQVEKSLRNIQSEMRTHNQIEIAKFKYLHPGFNFH